MTGTAGLFALRSTRTIDSSILLNVVSWRGGTNEVIDASIGWHILATGSASVAREGNVTVGLHGWIEDDDGSPTTDAAWLCRAVREIGIERLAARNGGFAAIVIDADRELAVGIRDFMGTRPLCWGATGHERSIASEPLAIPLLHNEQPKPDEETIRCYLDRQRPSDAATFVAGARAVPSNGMVRIAATMVSVSRHERLIEPRELSEQEAQHGTRVRLDQALRLRMHGSQRPSAHASGGVDSGVIAAAAAHHHPALAMVTHRVRGLNESDETGRAAELAARHSASHKIVEIDPVDTFELVNNDILIHGPTHPTMWLSGATITAAGNDKHDRLLVGQLSDEWLTMAGGPLAQAVWGRRLRPTVAFARAAITQDRVPTQEMLTRVARLAVGGVIRRRNFGRHVLDTFTRDGWIQRTMTGIERLGSLNDVQVEFPYADWEYVQFVLGLDVWHRNRPDEPKRLLRQAYADLLPASFVNDPLKANFHRVPELAFAGEATGSEAWAAMRSGWVDAWRAALQQL